MRNQARTTFQKEHSKFTNQDLPPRSRQMHTVRANTSFGMTNQSPMLHTLTPGQIQPFMPKPGVRVSLDHKSKTRTPQAPQFTVFSPSGEQARLHQQFLAQEHLKAKFRRQHFS